MLWMCDEKLHVDRSDFPESRTCSHARRLSAFCEIFLLALDRVDCYMALNLVQSMELRHSFVNNAAASCSTC